jgi:GNAT superfamily N-acetyltransferase
MNLQIIPWSSDHESWLRNAIMGFLDAGLERGGELLNTPKNVDAYLGIGLRGAAQGDPCLLAMVDGKPVAYVMWVGASNLIDLRWKTINAIGSYTDPEHRSKLIASALRDTALRITRERGYEKITGPVQLNNTRGVYEFCVTYGAWPTSVQFDILV